MKVLIVGGSYGALLGAAQISRIEGVEITVISPNTQVYFNIASPRLLFEEENVPKAFFTIEENLKSKCNGKAKHLQGKVTSVDLEKNFVVVEFEGSSQEIEYDHLVIATGTRGDACFQMNDNHEECLESLKRLNGQISEAKTIGVIGGGPTGFEVSGEIKGFNPDKKVIVFNKQDYPVHSFGLKFGHKAQKKLEDFGIQVLNNKTFVKFENGKASFEDGTDYDLDVAIITTSKPNSEFLPDEYKDQKGCIIADQYLRLKGNENKNVWVIGDVLSKGQKRVGELVHRQCPTVKANIVKSSEGKPLSSYTPSGSRISLPLHKSGGVGCIGSISLPSFLVYLHKGRSYGLKMANRFL